MGVRTLADGRTKLILLTAKPANPEAVTLAEAEAGIDASCQVAKSGTRISATASDTISDPPLCSDTNAQAFGAANYEGTLAPFWYLDPVTGAYDEADNEVYEATRNKGTTLWALLREGPRAAQELAVGDPYDLYEIVTDNPQRPSETGSYIKRNIPVAVQAAWQGEVGA